MTKSHKRSRFRKSSKLRKTSNSRCEIETSNLSPENYQIESNKGASRENGQFETKTGPTILNLDCNRFSKRITEVNAELESKETQIEAIKRGLDQERLLKEAAIRHLTRLMFTQGITTDDRHQLTAEGDAFVDRRKNLLRMDVSQKQNEEETKLKSILYEYEKKLHDKEIQLASLNDHATHLIRIYQRNRLDIEALNLGIVPINVYNNDEIQNVPTNVDDYAVASMKKEENSFLEKSSSGSGYSF